MAGVQEDAEGPADAEDRLLGLFESHHRRLYGLARRLTASPNEAEDMVQDTFLRVAQSLARVPQGSTEAEAWLVRVLVNVCRDQWRLRTNRRRLEAQYDTQSWMAAAGDTESALIAQTTIWSALRQLAPRRRAVIVLHELEGLEFPEIARLLGISPVTVRWHMARGRRELARTIEHQEGARR